MDRIYPTRYDEAQYAGLLEAARRFNVTGRQKAQRQINQLYMAFFGIIADPLSAAVMSKLVTDRLKAMGRRRTGKAAAT